MDGVSLPPRSPTPRRPRSRRPQYFDNNGSRGIYQDGWYACTFGPLIPWLPGAPGLAKWDANKDKWELYDLTSDFSQANDLAAKEPQQTRGTPESLRRRRRRKTRSIRSAPASGCACIPKTASRRLTAVGPSTRRTTRMPEFTAPGIGRESNLVTVEAEFGDKASGVLYALGGSSGGVTLFMDKGQLVVRIQHDDHRALQGAERRRFPPGNITSKSIPPSPARPLSPAEVVIRVDGKEVARTTVRRTVPAAFTASETFDVGIDLGAPVALDYAERRPFKFDGKIAIGEG